MNARAQSLALAGSILPMRLPCIPKKILYLAGALLAMAAAQPLWAPRLDIALRPAPYAKAGALSDPEVRSGKIALGSYFAYYTVAQLWPGLGMPGAGSHAIRPPKWLSLPFPDAPCSIFLAEKEKRDAFSDPALELRIRFLHEKAHCLRKAGESFLANGDAPGPLLRAADRLLALKAEKAEPYASDPAVSKLSDVAEEAFADLYALDSYAGGAQAPGWPDSKTLALALWAFRRLDNENNGQPGPSQASWIAYARALSSSSSASPACSRSCLALLAAAQAMASDSGLFHTLKSYADGRPASERQAILAELERMPGSYPQIPAQETPCLPAIMRIPEADLAKARKHSPALALNMQAAKAIGCP